MAYWKAEIRRREEKLNEAKTALHRKRITATFGNVAADSEEILMVRRAQAKLEQAEAKLKEVKQWYLTVEQEVSEYRGPSQQLGNALDSHIPRALSSLDRAADAVEAYLAVATPGASAPSPFSFTAAGGPTGISSAPPAPQPATTDQASPVKEPAP
ncbi:MAG: hypothetical protein QM775_27975 [Pirellulales bacterium]